MQLTDKVVVVTGGGNGIGRALCRRFAAEGSRGIVVVDLDEGAATAVADEIGGLAIGADVRQEDEHVRIVAAAEERFGPIDLYCSNAGIVTGGGVEVPPDEWQRIWEINTMAHVWGAKAVLPSMLARGGGYLLNTASAAGLLTNLGAAPYAVTKHAAVALAEWLAITHGDAGIRVSCLCPQGVRTNMLFGDGTDDDPASLAVRSQGVIEPEEVAEAVVRGIEAETFLILPHPEVLGYLQFKANDYDKWLGGMRKLQRRFVDGGG
jgi:NAD(P)-dependent dehydrogenase (short-subunit alcohol dehydrogenase family)